VSEVKRPELRSVEEIESDIRNDKEVIVEYRDLIKKEKSSYAKDQYKAFIANYEADLRQYENELATVNYILSLESRVKELERVLDETIDLHKGELYRE
jgi:hypothetical protein